MTREDIQTSQSFRTTEEKENHYTELKTAAESGWDFSSRWFIRDGTNKGTMVSVSGARPFRQLVPFTRLRHSLKQLLFVNKNH